MLAEVLSGSERKSRQQLTKAEWKSAFFDSREGKKASLAREGGSCKEGTVVVREGVGEQFTALLCLAALTQVHAVRLEMKNADQWTMAGVT